MANPYPADFLNADMSDRFGGFVNFTDPDNQPGGGGGAIAVSSTLLSSADLLALDTAPVQLLPAPSGRNYYVVQSFVLHYRPGATPYTGGDPGSLLVGLGVSTADLDGDAIGYCSGADGPDFAAAELFTQETDAYLIGPFAALTYTNWLASNIEAKPVSIYSQGSTFEDGDGSLTVRLFYGTINGA